MHRSPVPCFAGLRFYGRVAEKQGGQCFFIPGKQWPEVAHTAEGGREEAGEAYQSQAGEKAGEPAGSGGQEQKNPVDPQRVRQFQTGDGERGEQ